VLFTWFYVPLTALYTGQTDNGGSHVTEGPLMKTKQQILQRLLLAAALALPMAARADAAQGAGDEAPGAPEPGRHAMERRGPPPMHEGLREGEDIDGPRGPGFGRGVGPGPGPLGFGAVPPYLRGIELTEAQQDRIFTIVHGQVPYLREQMKARIKAERALAELHGAANFDDAAATRLAQAAAQAEANVTLAQLRTEQKVLAVLTGEQRKTLDERRNEQGGAGRREPGRPANR
jgi:Spy/CpxP family protein refolding chaperone